MGTVSTSMQDSTGFSVDVDLTAKGLEKLPQVSELRMTCGSTIDFTFWHYQFEIKVSTQLSFLYMGHSNRKFNS